MPADPVTHIADDLSDDADAVPPGPWPLANRERLPLSAPSTGSRGREPGRTAEHTEALLARRGVVPSLAAAAPGREPDKLALQCATSRHEEGDAQMTVPCKRHATGRGTQRAMEEPGQPTPMRAGYRPPDVRRKPVGGFAGPVSPDAPVGTYAGVPHLRRQATGSFAGDPNRQRQGSFADTDTPSPPPTGAAPRAPAPPARTPAADPDRARRRSEPSPHRVLIAGAGIGGLEAMIALRELAGDRLAVTLLSPGDEFLFRALSVQDAFARPAPRRYHLPDICAEHDAAFVHDRLELVEPRERQVTARSGRQIPYDSLLIAVGGERRPAFAGGATFRGPEDSEAIHGLIQDVEGGYTQRIAFVVPPGVTWPLPLYELALMTAERAWSACLEVALTIVTPEQEPLGIFGRHASGAVDRLLHDAGIAVLTATYVREVRHGAVLTPNGDAVVRAQRVVSLPRVVGPAIRGLPADADGFLPVDDDGRVRDTPGVWAAGDATTFPLKQGGIAAQQADAAARSIAAQAGAQVAAAPFRPTLRAKLLTGARATYLSQDIAGGTGDGSSTASDGPLWWPPTKVATDHLGPYLQRLDRRVQQRPGAVDAHREVVS
jgi:sulfide:quinone oxidoreductase